jgi:hypothetical protein
MNRFSSRAVICLLLLLLLLCSSTGTAADKIKNLCQIPYPSDAKVEWTCRTLKWTDTPSGLFGAHWPDLLRFNRLDRRHFYGGVSVKVPKDLNSISHFSPLPLTYPEAAQRTKFILIDQSEMFLGAYEQGRLVLSFPIAVGIEGYRLPNGSYQIDAADRRHESNLYTVEEIGRPYPMHYGLRFFVDKTVEGWPSYWIHGRDLPGYPASHGCIGLYDEEMQFDYYSAYDKKVDQPYYHELTRPFLQGAERLYQWVVDPASDPGGFHLIKNGPQVVVIGEPPI